METETKALPPAARRAIPVFYWGGWISFWTQLFLAIIAGAMLLASIPFEMARSSSTGSGGTSGMGFAIFLSGMSLLGLVLSVFWSFRYKRFARLLRERDARELPKKSSAIQMLKRGLYISLSGAFVTLLGTEAIAGSLFLRALQTQGTIPLTAGQASELVNGIDIFVVLANTHTIFAHFIGISTSLFLLNSITRE